MIGSAGAGDSPTDVQPDFQELYEEHVDFAWRNLRRLGVPAMSIEDAVQDVFLVAHRKLPSFAGRSSVRTWIYAITRRIAFRYRRGDARARRKREALEVAPRDDVALEQRIVLRQAARILSRFLDELDPLKREAFVLGALEGFTRSELGEALGVSPNTAYSRLRAARVAFEARFGPVAGERAAMLLDGARLADTPASSDRDRVGAIIFGLVPKAAVTSAAGIGIKVAIGAIALAATATIALASGRPPRPQDAPASTPSTVAEAALETDPEQGRTVTGGEPPASEPAPSAVRTSEDGELDHAMPSSTPHGKTRRVRPVDPPVPSALSQETALMERIRKALAQERFDAALEHLREHERRFADGVLVLERRASRIAALCGKGLVAQARGEAHNFLRAHPEHPLATAALQSCPSIEPAGSGDQP